jgi:hypothetical protein
MYRIEFLKPTRPIKLRCVVEANADSVPDAYMYAQREGLTNNEKVTFIPIKEFTSQDKVDEFNSHQYQVLLQYK